MVRQFLYLFFASHGVYSRVEKFEVGDFLRLMRFCVSGAFAACMKPCSSVYVFGVSRVEAPIHAQDDVHIEGHLPPALPEVKWFRWRKRDLYAMRASYRLPDLFLEPSLYQRRLCRFPACEHSGYRLLSLEGCDNTCCRAF